MARVELQTTIVGKGYIRYPGEIFECDAATAKRLLKSGQAIPARKTAGIEHATNDPSNQEKGAE